MFSGVDQSNTTFMDVQEYFSQFGVIQALDKGSVTFEKYDDHFERKKTHQINGEI